MIPKKFLLIIFFQFLFLVPICSHIVLAQDVDGDNHSRFLETGKIAYGPGIFTWEKCPETSLSDHPPQFFYGGLIAMGTWNITHIALDFLHSFENNSFATHRFKRTKAGKVYSELSAGDSFECQNNQLPVIYSCEKYEGRLRKILHYIIQNFSKDSSLTVMALQELPSTEKSRLHEDYAREIQRNVKGLLAKNHLEIIQNENESMGLIQRMEKRSEQKFMEVNLPILENKSTNFHKLKIYVHKNNKLCLVNIHGSRKEKIISQVKRLKKKNFSLCPEDYTLVAMVKKVYLGLRDLRDFDMFDLEFVGDFNHSADELYTLFTEGDLYFQIEKAPMNTFDFRVSFGKIMGRPSPLPSKE
jgi:hypothetical protein